MNPRAGRETELVYWPSLAPKRVFVIGAGPAGLSCATVAAERGHRVVLFDSADAVGGQFNLARRIPGKQEFDHTLRYFRNRLATLGVDLRLSTAASAADVAAERPDVVVLATGVRPRSPSLPGIDHPKVVSYVDVLARGAPVGPRVAIIGAGGIGFDVAEYLTHEPAEAAIGDVDAFIREWGIDPELRHPGGVVGGQMQAIPARRQVWLLQRKPTKPGEGLGRTTGWIHRTRLRRRGVQMIGGVSYERIDDAGLHLRVDGRPRVLAVDTVVICAGQEPQRDLEEPLRARGFEVHRIGGADVAAELDAKRAIEQGARVAAGL